MVDFEVLNKATALNISSRELKRVPESLWAGYVEAREFASEQEVGGLFEDLGELLLNLAGAEALSAYAALRREGNDHASASERVMETIVDTLAGTLA
jgi:hypothetical protein